MGHGLEGNASQRRLGVCSSRVAPVLLAMAVLWGAWQTASVVVEASTGASTSATTGAPRTIEIHAKQFKFEPSEITIRKGETVKLVLYSDDVPHALAVAGLPIHADMVKGHPSTVLVTPEQTGDFQGKCSKFCGAGHRDMHFVVHVVS